MKILHISKYYYPYIGGVEQVAKDVVDALKDNEDVEQKIICFNEDIDRDGFLYHKKETRIDCIDGVDVIRCGYQVKMSSQSLSFTYAKQLKKLMDDFVPDVIFFHYPNPFVCELLQKYYKRRFKLIVYWHLDITKQKVLGKLFRIQNKRLLERADKIIATSKNYIEGSEYLIDYKRKCIAIPNCIRTDRLEVTGQVLDKVDRIKESNKGKYICFSVGRHVPYKGYEYLIEASKYLGDNICVCIAGAGPLTSELKELAKNNSKVKFLGRLSDEDLAAYYSACDLICFPSITKNEAFGIALAEGMYFSKPAITFTIKGSGVNFVNLNYVTGIECPNRDTKAYAKAIIELCSNSKLRTDMGNNARKRVLDEFTEKKFKQNIIDLIRFY